MADLSLADLIAHVESSNRLDALRFEPTVFSQWNGQTRSQAMVEQSAIISKYQMVNRNTADMIAATSWGKFQILGENLFHPAMMLTDVKLSKYLATDDLQNTAFQRFLVWRRINFALVELMQEPAKLETFITHWNGPGNIAGYRKRMVEVYAFLGGRGQWALG